ncbi:MAG: glycogen debranching protein, partial [Chloroflexi bacterium]|nr:glycogen debranching protein [Chloroflexota bacterium]
IQVDAADGLLRAGVPGVQLTWMDARVGDYVVTPRTGKPVEIQALWYNALRLMETWAPECNDDPAPYQADADRIQAAFPDRFWKPDGGYLLDVADGPEGDDAAFRPNQLFALSLPYPLISGDRAQSVIAGCEAKLLTPCGLRTLDPADSHYAGVCTGDAGRRDGAYHQGTVWPWLIGPYVDAVLNTTGDVNRAGAALQPLLEQVSTAGVGFISEIFDGDAPHHPRGCIAQAWSVAEVLRSLSRIEAAREAPNGQPRPRRERRK